MRFLPQYLAPLLLLPCCAGVNAQNPSPPQKTPTPTSKAAPSEKGRLNPTRDPSTKSGVYVPKNLDDALKELRHMLPPEAVAEMRKGTETNMWRYHLSLGMWLRNNWGLWRGERLAKWFNARGIEGADDISGIIMISYWRSLHKKPIGLDTQIKQYKAYAEQAKKDEAEEKQRVRRVGEQITHLMLGLQSQSVTNSTIPQVALPTQPTGGIRIRYATPFFVGGALLTAKTNPGTKYEDFITPAYVLDLTREQLRPVQLPEIARIENAVVMGNGATAYFHGPSSGNTGSRKEVLIEIRANGHRQLLPPPPGMGFIRLGLGAHNDLLAVRPQGVYRWRPENKSPQQWEQLYATSAKNPLPRSGVPPQIWGNRLYFRDEGRYEDDKRLSWLNLALSPKSARSPGLVYFDQNIGLIGPYGPRWENVWSYVYDAGQNSATGTLWLSTGSIIGQASLLRWTPTEGYRVALFNGGVRFSGDFFEGGDARKNSDTNRFAVTGIEVHHSDSGTSSIHAVGPLGFFEIDGGQIRTLVRFTDNWDWIPTHILTLNQWQVLLGGHFGGIYLLTKPVIAEDGFRLIPLDEHLGPPIRL